MLLIVLLHRIYSTRSLYEPDPKYRDMVDIEGVKGRNLG